MIGCLAKVWNRNDLRGQS